MLIGRGEQYSIENPNVFTHSWNAHLFWRHPWSQLYDQNGAGRRGYGMIGYSTDWDITNHSEPFAYIRSSNLFCSGHTLLDDGRLFVVGGSYHPLMGHQPTHGLFSLFIYDAEQWRNDASGVQAGWMGSAATLPAQQLPLMSEKRWYASPMLLQDGSALIVGGIDNTGGSTACFGQVGNPRFTTSFELYHPHNNTLANYPLAAQPCDASGGFQSGDQRRFLGNEYPRLHLVSFMQGTQVTSRTTYNGPLYPIFVLDSQNKMPGCAPPATGAGAWSWKRKNGAAHDGGPYPTFTRSGGATVLLPRMDGNSNPINAAGQVLYEVARIGGNEGCVPHSGSDFARVYTYQYRAEPSEHDTMASHAAMGLYPPSRPGAKYPSAVILPNGDLFVGGGMKHANDQNCVWHMGQHVRYECDIARATNGSWQNAAWDPVATMSSVDIDRDYPLHSETHIPKFNRGLLTPDGARMYHSTMSLMPDGRVLASGTDMDSHEQDDAYWNNPDVWGYGNADPRPHHRRVRNLYPTIYSPPYLFKPNGDPIVDATDRPRVLGILSIMEEQAAHSQVVQVLYALPTGRQVKAVHLVRPGSVTHSVDFDQRLVRCHFTPEQGSQPQTGSLSVTMPWSNQIAPPGWYMLFLIDSEGVPSIASWIRLLPPFIGGDCIADPEMEFLMEGAGEEEAADCGEETVAVVRPLHMPPIEVRIESLQTGRSMGVYRLAVNGMDADGLVRCPLPGSLPEGDYALILPTQEGFLARRLVARVAQGQRIPVALLTGDVNGDNVVDSADLALMVQETGLRSDREQGRFLRSDLNKDGLVDPLDMEILLRSMGRRGD